MPSNETPRTPDSRDPHQLDFFITKEWVCDEDWSAQVQALFEGSGAYHEDFRRSLRAALDENRERWTHQYLNTWRTTNPNSRSS